jgi:hypothetical protein
MVHRNRQEATAGDEAARCQAYIVTVREDAEQVPTTAQRGVGHGRRFAAEGRLAGLSGESARLTLLRRHERTRRHPAGSFGYSGTLVEEGLHVVAQ